MIKRLLFFVLLLTISKCTLTTEQHQENSYKSVAETTLKRRLKSKRRNVRLKFEDEDIVDFVNFMAEKVQLNVILPQGGEGEEFSKVKLNLNIDRQLTLQEAWNLLISTLDISGYALIPRHDQFIIQKIDNNITRKSLPVYVGNPDQLPNTDQMVGLIYYFENIPAPANEGTELGQMITTMLSTTGGKPPATFKFDQLTNALIIVDKANNIKSIMSIITEIDRTGFKQTVEVMQLTHTQAGIAAQLINEQILNLAAQQRGVRPGQKTTKSTYFEGIRVVAIPRTNSLVIMGRAPSVERMKDFIKNHLDVAQETGKSVLHTYDLQYLDAAQFAPVLRNIVSSTDKGRQAAAKGKQKGPVRFFDGVTVETSSKKEAPKKEGEAPSQYAAGNKLVIAARNDDWKRIKPIIEQLDVPQPQVIIEVLVADITLEDDRILGAQLRNSTKIKLPDGVTLQAAHLNVPVLDNFAGPPEDIGTNLATDLMQDYFDSNGKPRGSSGAGAITNSLAELAASGSTILTLGENRMDDGTGQSTGIWGILQLLKKQTNVKVLSNPHVISTNNKEAIILVEEERRVTGKATSGEGGAFKTEQERVWATLLVKVTPRIGADESVNLQVSVEVEDFVDRINTTSGNKNTRKVITNANIQSGQVLSLGGLIRNETTHSKSETPVLSKIPILGNLFKKTTTKETRNNLTIFISPTIIMPRLRGGIGNYTKDYINLARDYVDESMLFDTLRDPITRWFFKTETDPHELIDTFEAKEERIEIDGERAVILANNDTPEKQRTPFAQHITQRIKPQRITQKNERANKLKKKLAGVTPPVRKQLVATREKTRADKMKELLAIEGNPLREL